MKTVIVTGASSGIGYEISKTLLKLNYKVYGLGRTFKDVINNNNFIPIICDLLDINSLIKIIKEIRKKEQIYMLVNNAGVGYFGLHEELNSLKIHEMVTINLEVPLILSQILLRDIKKNSGFIINISSITAKKSSPHGCAYAATKAGLSHFSNSLFDEARKHGVKVIAIHPDMTKTNFYRNANFKEGDNEETYINPNEVSSFIEIILKQRKDLVITDITLRPQKHQISKK